MGLIAGNGGLPAIVIRLMAARKRPVVAVTFDKRSFDNLAGEGADLRQVGLGQASKVIGIFRGAGVKEVAFAGKVDKRAIYENPRFDLRALSILGRAALKNDDAIMNAIVAELEKEGMTVASQMELLRDMIPGPGNLARRKPGRKEERDVAFGMRMAKGIAALDIGQTVVVKDGAVVAAEAIEGTDEAIMRGGRIAGPGAVVCKVSKPRQDPRFDVPTVGRDTVEAMIACGASVLAIEARATLVVNLTETAALCAANKISFVSL